MQSQPFIKRSINHQQKKRDFFCIYFTDTFIIVWCDDQNVRDMWLQKRKRTKKINSTIFWYELEKELYLVKKNRHIIINKQPKQNTWKKTVSNLLYLNDIHISGHVISFKRYLCDSFWFCPSIQCDWEKKDAMMDCSKKNSIVTKSILIINFFCTKNKNLWVCVCCSSSLAETKNT